MKKRGDAIGMEMLFRCVIISVSIFSCGCGLVTHAKGSHIRGVGGGGRTRAGS